MAIAPSGPVLPLPTRTKLSVSVSSGAGQMWLADLLVMGAWGRSRISELVLGGTTHQVLSRTHLPLLLAH